MDTETIYKLNWQYDYWSDIESVYPKGSIVECKVTYVDHNYAFLETHYGVICFLHRSKVSALWVVTDLAEEIKIGDVMDCKVIDYNYEKKSLTISLNLN